MTKTSVSVEKKMKNCCEFLFNDHLSQSFLLSLLGIKRKLFLIKKMMDMLIKLPGINITVMAEMQSTLRAFIVITNSYRNLTLMKYFCIKEKKIPVIYIKP